MRLSQPVAYTTIRSKAVVLWLLHRGFIYMYLLLFVVDFVFGLCFGFGHFVTFLVLQSS